MNTQGAQLQCLDHPKKPQHPAKTPHPWAKAAAHARPETAHIRIETHNPKRNAQDHKFFHTRNMLPCPCLIYPASTSLPEGAFVTTKSLAKHPTKQNTKPRTTQPSRLLGFFFERAATFRLHIL
jgi:hypothetical protein